MWYKRSLEYNHQDLFRKGKVFVLYGPRRTGKTSLINKLLENFTGKTFRGSGDDLQTSEILSSQKSEQILSAFRGYDLVFIDEAQRIPGIGMGLKILTDNSPELIIVATGSSSFELANKVGEPLTGRSYIHTLFPISMLEIEKQFGSFEIMQKLENFLIYGTYPEVLTSKNNEEKKDYLFLLRDAYLFKDILELESIRNSSKLINLLRLLAFQIGHEVSLNELSRNLEIAKQTVERYLDLLEKTFIIKKVPGFSRNLRNEVTKTARYYFWDNGIRNAVINNFNPVVMRNDIGMLWENFLFIERIKKQSYKKIYSNNYFWRTYDRKEIDFVEERDGRLYGFEFKWSKKKSKPPKIWTDTYKEASYETITKENFIKFLI